jgi:hypothetical protein
MNAAHESGEERPGEAAGALAMVELQQFRFGQGDGGGVSHSDRLRALAIGVSWMRKAHGQKIADRGYPLGKFNLD